MKKTKTPNISGREYWRSLDQLADNGQFRKFLEKEFPGGTAHMDNAWSRRNFMTLMGASLALAGLASCRRPEEKIVPYVKAPEEIIPGQPRFFATSMPRGMSACGLVVESHEGRPTKIEGNSLHPSSLGASDMQVQASILGLYDPDRSQSVVNNGKDGEWTDFVSFWQEHSKQYRQNKGTGLAVLTTSYSSPSLARLSQQFRKNFPQAEWAVWDAISDENIYAGVRIATGQDLKPVYNFSKAHLILSLDSDFLHTESDSIVAARGFADGRRLNTEKDRMNRLYVVESQLSLTGGMADHRLRMTSRNIMPFLLSLCFELRDQGLKIKALDGLSRPKVPAVEKKWIEWLKPLAKDLTAHAGQSLLLAGYRQPPAVHALTIAINEALKNFRKTISFAKFEDAEPSKTSALTKLIQRMDKGEISTLVILGGNPAYNCPADLKFKESLKKVDQTIHLSLYRDETSRLTAWHIPMTHYLESWGDTRSLDNTLAPIQPLIRPLFGGHSNIEILNLIANGTDLVGHDLVRQTWKDIIRDGSYEKQWRRVLHDGILAGSGKTSGKLRLRDNAIGSSLGQAGAERVPDGNNMEVVFAVSPTLYDGATANNGWLQELPHPISKISWDNAALMSKTMAESLGLANGDIVELRLGSQKQESPIWIVPGHADNSITLEMGFGRTGAGKIGDGVGVNAYLMRSSSSPGFDSNLKVTKTGMTREMANTQDHSSMEGRPIVREATHEEFQRNPGFAAAMVQHPPLKSMWNEHTYDEGYQWGMTIDLNTCTGCSACTIACQSENNIPIVGRQEVRNGREMHWIRLDRYFTGSVEDAEVVQQPVACMHCEDAPCEQVCPVAATTHDKEGLNTMVYNRCIGTRYCSNNCPYKVRRFNFYNLTKDIPEIVKMAQNPDVTIRSRGVMEKCTYCIQRINSVKITAKKENRLVADGEIVTACQQVCPTKAITFGNIRDDKSEVAQLKKNKRDYSLLAELNTKPRTSYLAKIRNRNPEMVR